MKFLLALRICEGMVKRRGLKLKFNKLKIKVYIFRIFFSKLWVQPGMLFPKPGNVFYMPDRNNFSVCISTIPEMIF